MRARLRTEVAWLIALSDQKAIIELPPLTVTGRDALTHIVRSFNENGALRIKAIEATTNHDVKAIEYYLREEMAQHAELHNALEFVHFALTSEDINNVAYTLMVQEARTTILLPTLSSLIQQCENLAIQEAHTPMLARTHGQPASPTTVGKEMRVFTTRLQRLYQHIHTVPLLAKINGAVGCYNAHYIAYPEVEWPAVARTVLTDLGLVQNPHTTQIEPHDALAELCHSLIRFNTVLLDLCRDLWGYISLGYFRQKTKSGEIGSSTMPHKVNPIDFENAEGNLGLANALLDHLAMKLPISRFQRDLSDSTVLRNLGSALGYAVLAYTSCAKGLAKLEVDHTSLQADLDQHWEVLTEAVQTVMRRYGIAGGYERLKDISRGQSITAADLTAFIHSLDLPDAAKTRLLALTPQTYIGNAATLAKNQGGA